MVGQRDFSGPRDRAAADQRHRRGGVVRVAECAALPRRQVVALARHRADRGQFQRLVLAQWRQDARQAAGEHGLAGAGRAAQEQVVGAGRGDLQRAPRLRLAAHVGEIGLGFAIRGGRGI